MRSTLHFPADGGVPYDLAAEITDWFPEGTAPTATSGQLFPAHTFDGAGGYRVAAPEEVNGNRSVALRLVLKPDFDALDGVGRVTLMAIGEAGPLLTQAHSWGFALKVTGSVVKLLGYYQNLSLVVQEVEIASVAVPSDQTVPHVYGFARETAGQTAYWRVSVDGVVAGETSHTIDVPFVTGVALTLGYRDDQGTPAEFYQGDVEVVVLDAAATTVEQERHAWMARDFSISGKDRIRALMSGYYDMGDGTVYHDTRIRPLADGFGDLEARLAAVAESAVWRPYGTQLDAWRRALNVIPGDATLGEVQSLVAATMADQGGFTSARLRQIVADLTEVALVDVDMYETNNERNLPDTAALDTPASGPWRVRGYGWADLTSTGLALNGLAGADMRWLPLREHALEVWRALRAPVYSAALPMATHTKGGFSGILEAVTNATATEWAGITLAGRAISNAPAATHIGIYGAGPNYTLAYRRSTDAAPWGATLNAWTSLGTIATGNRLGVSYSAQRGNWVVSVETTPGDSATQTVYDLASVPALLDRVGFAIVSEGTLAADVTVRWTSPHVLYPDFDTAKYYFLISDMAVKKNHVTHSNAIRANERPTTLGSVTYGAELVAASADTVLGYSPMVALAERPLALPDFRQSTSHLTTRDPAHLWTFQESSGDIIDRRHFDRFTVSGSNNSYLAAGGPDGRNAFAFTDDSTTGDYALAQRSSTMNSGSGTSLIFVLVYKYDPVAPVADTVLRKRQTASSKEYRLHVSASTNWTWRVSDGSTLSTITVPVTTGAWDVVAVGLNYVSGNTYTLNIANRSTSNTATTAFGTTLSTNNPLSLGDDSGTLETANITYRWLTGVSGAQAVGVDDSYLQEICRRVYATI